MKSKIKSLLLPLLLLANFQAKTQCWKTATAIKTCVKAANNPQFWNHPLWLDKSNGLADLAEDSIKIELELTDTCGNPPAPLHFQLHLDLDNDGSPETVVSDTNQTLAGFIFIENRDHPNFSGGLLRRFDFRPTDAAARFRFSIRQVAVGSTISAAVVWAAADGSSEILPQLPLGKHSVRWFSGSQLVREDLVWVSDCVVPRLFCKPLITMNIAPFLCRATIWNNDAIDSIQENATVNNLLEISSRRQGFGSGFPLNQNGMPVPGNSFEIFYELIYGFPPVMEIWVRDKAGNTDSCTIAIEVYDPWDMCHPPTHAVLTTYLKTKKGEGIEDATVLHEISHPAFSNQKLWGQTGDDGYSKVNVKMFSDCKIAPKHNLNWLNGVTTFDLLLISKHILGTQILNDPRKVIAADANRSGAVTTNDIVVLRKLILGITDTIADNTSWRFVPADFQFSDTLNPFQQPFPEFLEIKNLSAPATVQFVGFKIGDINGNAIANSFSASDDRAPQTFLVENQKLTAGNEYILPVGCGSQHQISGFQIGLKIDPTAAVLQEILPAAAPDFSAENFATSPDGSVSISWFDAASTARTSASEPLIFLKIKVLRDCRVSEILSLDNSRLLPEAYDSEVSIRKLDLQFFEKSGVREPFLLFPNPTSGEVFLEMKNLTQPAQFEIFDALGRSLRRGELVEPRTRLDVSEFLAGQFFVKILSGGSVLTLIFFKN